MAQVIILAGGMSKRVGKNKMCLPYKGKYLLEHVIDTFSPYVNKVVIVTGHYHDDIIQKITGNEKTVFCQNQNYLEGMFTSIQRGAKEVSEDFFVIPGDMPKVSIETIQSMLNCSALMCVPSYKGIKGHPLKISKELILDLLNEDPSSNLKVFRNRYPLTVIPVEDEGILKDIDTMNDYYSLE